MTIKELLKIYPKCPKCGDELYEQEIYGEFKENVLYCKGCYVCIDSDGGITN